MTQGGLPPAVVIEGAQRLVEAASTPTGDSGRASANRVPVADMVAVAVDTARKQWQTDAAGGVSWLTYWWGTSWDRRMTARAPPQRGSNRACERHEPHTSRL